MHSKSIERALCTMCNTREFTHPTNGTSTKLYSFDLDKTLEHFAVKYEKIKSHLAQKYVRENQGFIEERNKGLAQRRGVIKQEVKGVVKTESIKSEHYEVKSEQGAMEIDATEYEVQFEVMAMGVVADELPQSCIEPFLRYIKETNKGGTQLF